MPDSPFPAHGSLCALVTPMLEDGTVCIEALERLVHFHAEAGTAGLVLAGTTGESSTLTVDERGMLIRASARAAAGRLPIIAGTGTPDPRQSIELSRQAAGEGADALMLVVPAYSRPPQQGLYRHFMTIAEAVSLPIMLYNVPHRTACDLLPETTARLAAHPQIGAIKDSLGRERFEQLSECLGERGDFRLYGGTDELLLESLEGGADGIVSVTANLVPARIAAICKLFAEGDRAAAEARHRQLMPLHRALFAESNPIAIKWALHGVGLLPEAPGIRLPLVPASDSTRRELSPLLASLKECGLGV